MRRRFQRAAGLTDDEIAAAVAAAMPQPVEAVPFEEAIAVEEVGATEENIAEIPVEAAADETLEVPVEVVEATPVAGDSIPAPEAVVELPEIEIIEEAAEPQAQPQAESTEEVDLSSEWSSLLEETKPQPEHAEPPAQAAAEVPEAAAEPVVEEIELSDFLNEPEVSAEVPPPAEPVQASAPAAEHGETMEFEVPVQPVHLDEEPSMFAEISAELPPDVQETTAEPAQEAIIDEHAGEKLLPDEELTALPVPEHSEVAEEGPEPALEIPLAALPESPKPEPEFELDQDFELILEPEPVVPAHEMLSEIPVAPPAPEPEPDQAPAMHAMEQEGEQGAARVNGTSFTSEQFLADLANEIDELGLGDFAETKTSTKQPVEATQELAKTSASGNGDLESGPLKEVFEEFRAELGEMGAEDEDLETHYNLGIAFREMGLLEEAIGEFQKVAKANDRGKAFRYAMQCCTLLGLAFMEKGQPAIAAIWYERALQTPGIDSESKLALRYDLGVAQESAGDLEAAIRSFSQVYAVNIDYRDVADRIAAHQKPAV